MDGHVGVTPRRIWSVIAKGAVTGTVLWYLLRKVPLAGIGNALEAAAPAWVILGIALQIAVRLINALRIRLIARFQGAPLSYQGILSTLFTTAMYALVIPGSIGAGAATLVKYVGQGASLAAALASMVVNRLLDTVAIVSLGAFFWGLEHSASPAAAISRFATIALLAAPLLFIGGHALLFGRVTVLARLAARVRAMPRLRSNALLHGFAGVLEQCARASSLSASAAGAVLALSLVKELLASSIAYCFAHAVGVELAFVTIAWMQGIVSLLILLPITLSGLGVREGALIFASRPYGVDAAHALSWGLVQFGGVLCMALIGGVIEARALWSSPAEST